MNPYKICFTCFALVYAVIALLGSTVALGVTLVGIVGMLWCCAGWVLADKYL